MIVGFYIAQTAAAVLLHELGHIASAALLGIKCRGISWRMSGALLTFDFSGASYGREFIVHLAGPAVGMISAATAALLFREFNVFIGASALLAGVNLIPIRIFDGGAMLLCIMKSLMPEQIAEMICRAVSVAAGVLLYIAAVWIELHTAADIGLIVFAVCVMLYGVLDANFQ